MRGQSIGAGIGSKPVWRLARPATLISLLMLAGCVGAAPDARDAGARQGRPDQPARARTAMVATANPLASEAGLAVLRRGGSAIDAAIAAQMVLNLVEPQSSGIGGGAFLLHYSAKDGKVEAYDGREWAPASAKPDMFLGPDGKPRSFRDVRPGGLSVGVPGLLRMLEFAHKDHGKLDWAALFAPAATLADEGFDISPRMAKMIAETKDLGTFTSASRYFFTADGKPKSAGTHIVNREFAETLRTIADGGADAFYKGPVAQAIVRTVRNAAFNPAMMSEDDLASYEAKKREPVCLFYRIYLVCGAPPPSSGGITTLQILGLVQKFDLDKLTPGSPQAIHLIAEASRIAFADRNTYIADPDFIPVPSAGMLDPGYLALRARDIQPGHSIGKADPGMPGIGAAKGRGPDEAPGGVSTTHLSVVDAEGNAVSMTSSIESAFGSRLMVKGFLLNNQLTDFSYEPEVGGAPVANRVEPHKRPRSSMAPTLVLDGGGKLVMALGSPGGSQIIGYVTKTLIAGLDWKMDVQKAISYPNFLNRNGPTELEAGTSIVRLKPTLESYGQSVEIREFDSGVQAIMVMPGGGLAGGADPRREGVALGD